MRKLRTLILKSTILIPIEDLDKNFIWGLRILPVLLVAASNNSCIKQLTRANAI